MTFKEAEKLCLGDIVRIRNTHKVHSSRNSECLFKVIGIRDGRSLHNPLKYVDMILISDFDYKDWNRNRSLKKGETITRTNAALIMVEKTKSTDIYDEIASFWGERMPMMLIEELSELAQAVTKYERNIAKPESKEKREDVVKEMADVYISLEAIKRHYAIDDKEVLDKIALKTSRKY